MESTQPADSGRKRTWKKGNRMEVRGDHAVIFIPCKGEEFEALIDIDDLPTAQNFTWSFTAGYAANQSYPDGKDAKKVLLYLHRLLMGLGAAQGHSLQVDHINRNRLDNRRANLRLVTPSQNMANIVRQPSTCGDGFRGVSYNHQGWKAQIAEWAQGGVRRTKYLGTYETPEEAARAYDLAAVERDGVYAVLNFPKELDRYLRGKVPAPQRRSKRILGLKVMPDLRAAS